MSLAKQPSASEQHRFNMIEVVLGIGLIVFGLVTTLGLFPVGLSAARNAIGETYAADSADQFLHFLATRLRVPTDDYANWDGFGKKLPEEKPTSAEPPDGEWIEWFSEDTVTYWRGGSLNQFYRIEQKAAGSAVADFLAVYRVWREGVSYSRYVDGAWEEVVASADVALAINLEVSWPEGLPYERRQKALYSLEVYKPQ